MIIGLRRDLRRDFQLVGQQPFGLGAIGRLVEPAHALQPGLGEAARDVRFGGQPGAVDGETDEHEFRRDLLEAAEHRISGRGGREGLRRHQPDRIERAGLQTLKDLRAALARHQVVIALAQALRLQQPLEQDGRAGIDRRGADRLALEVAGVGQSLAADQHRGMTGHRHHGELGAGAALLDIGHDRVARVVHDVERARRDRLLTGRDADRYHVHLDAGGGKESFPGRDHTRPQRRGGRYLAECHPVDGAGRRHAGEEERGERRECGAHRRSGHRALPRRQSGARPAQCFTRVQICAWQNIRRHPSTRNASAPCGLIEPA